MGINYTRPRILILPTQMCRELTTLRNQLRLHLFPERESFGLYPDRHSNYPNRPSVNTCTMNLILMLGNICYKALGFRCSQVPQPHPHRDAPSVLDIRTSPRSA